MTITLSRHHFKALRNQRGGVLTVKEKKTIQEIEQAIGLSGTKPLTLSENDDKVALKDADYFSDWYEEELRELYERE